MTRSERQNTAIDSLEFDVHPMFIGWVEVFTEDAIILNGQFTIDDLKKIIAAMESVK